MSKKIKSYYIVVESKGYNPFSFYCEAENKTKAVEKVVSKILNDNVGKFTEYQITDLTVGDSVLIIISFDNGIDNFEYLGKIVDFESGGGDYFVLTLDTGEKVSWIGYGESENRLRIGQEVYMGTKWTLVKMGDDYN